MSDEETIILPKRFLRLNYLKGTGTQYIDSGYIPTNNTGFWIDSKDNGNEYNYLMGLSNTADWNANQRMYLRNSLNLVYGWNEYVVVNETNSTGKRNIASLNYLNSKKAQFELDGNVYESETIGDLSFTPTIPIFIFAINFGGTVSSHISKVQIYEVKISENEQIVRHFIPAYDTYNLKECMYEVVQGKAYYNKGSGNFEYEFDEESITPKEDYAYNIFHKLPDGFKKVDSLIANGIQWIDTNYVPSNETGYYVDGQSYTNDEGYFFGCVETTNWGDNKRIYARATPNFVYGWMGYYTILDNNNYKRLETEYQFNLYNSRKVIVSINEEQFTSAQLLDLSFTPTKKLYLFAINRADVEVYRQLKGRINTFIITEGDEIVRHFVPCLDADGVPCMYELYTGVVHYNKGMGQFSYPRSYTTNEVINLPADYKKCAYLQSDGTQYIDTGVVPNNETGLYLKAQRLNYGDCAPFGSWESGQSYFYPMRFNTTNKFASWAFGTTYQLGFYYDKGDDLIYTSTMNLYNDRTIRFYSEDTEWHGKIGFDCPNTITRSMWLFSYNMDNSTINATHATWGGRIFRAKITYENELIRDFVPCLDENGKPCMFDLVTQTPFYNLGNGNDFDYCIEHQLPSDFIKLKYLESNDKQYIKTGYIPTNNTGMYLDGYNTVVADTVAMGMQNTTSGDDRMWIGGVMASSYGARYGWGKGVTPGGNGKVRFVQTLNWLNNKQSIINCPAFVQKINTLTDLTFIPNRDILIFGWNRGGTVVGWKGRVYRAKISEGSEIVRDFVPAWDDTKQVACLYDLIENKAYYNSGSGNFLMNSDREGLYVGFGFLGGIGNRLGVLYKETE